MIVATAIVTEKIIVAEIITAMKIMKIIIAAENIVTEKIF